LYQCHKFIGSQGVSFQLASKQANIEINATVFSGFFNGYEMAGKAVTHLAIMG